MLDPCATTTLEAKSNSQCATGSRTEMGGMCRTVHGRIDPSTTLNPQSVLEETPKSIPSFVCICKLSHRNHHWSFDNSRGISYDGGTSISPAFPEAMCVNGAGGRTSGRQIFDEKGVSKRSACGEPRL